MRKLLIFMLILGLASVAQGDEAWFEIDDWGTVPPVGTGGTIQFNLVADLPCVAFKMGLVFSTDGAGTVPGSPGDNTPVSSPILVDAGYVINGAYGQPGLLFDYASGSGPAVAAGDPIASFDYIIPSGWSAPFNIYAAPPGTAYIDGFGDPYVCDLSYVESYDGKIIPIVVPEPATIVLLGLGGLLLRRRK